MTIDDSYISNAEMVRRGHEADEADARARYEEQRLCESDEATEAYWQGVFAAMPDDYRRAEYKTVGQGYDTRLFGGSAS